MKANYINPFIKASIEMIEIVSGVKLNASSVYTKDVPYNNNDGLVVLIGVTGGLHGNVVISFSKDICCRIAAYMMGCDFLTEIDEIAKSAIGELCNMTLGRTATLLSKDSILIDITPPTFLMGDNIKLSTPNIVKCIPLQYENKTQIEINISFTEFID